MLKDSALVDAAVSIFVVGLAVAMNLAVLGLGAVVVVKVLFWMNVLPL